MRLFLLSVRYHFRTHWSSGANFWSGVLGMLVNNTLTLLGIWAMLFAGKTGLAPERDVFFLMNFVLMLAWGIIHVLLGGVTRLDTQISHGGLDSAMVSPRNPYFALSLTASHLPAWGDVILGGVGLLVYAALHGPLFLLHGLLMAALATFALFSFYLLVGSLAFWFRRTEAASSVLVNLCLAFNTYPVHSGSAHWLVFLLPLLLVGVVPARFLLDPSWGLLAVEAAGSAALFLCALWVFRRGLRRYQSAAVLGLQRN